MQNNIIFLYSSKPTIGKVGTPGKTITILSKNGVLTHNKYLIGEDEPYEKHDRILTENQIVKFRGILNKYHNKIHLLPDNMSKNRMGIVYDIQIGNKKIHGINIWRGLETKEAKILHSVMTLISLALNCKLRSETLEFELNSDSANTKIN